MTHAAIAPGRVAVITGGASGIGLAFAARLAAVGMRLCLADRNPEQLAAAVAGIDGDCFGQVTDVSRLDQVEALRDAVYARYGEVAILMNNAGTGGGGTAWQRYDGWRKVLGVNLWGVINGVQTFAQAMIDQATPAAIINTGSKQGLTNPPGDLAYNVSKAGVRTLTEGLAHELRQIEGCQVTAHLLIPGFTYTGLIKARIPEKPAAAWWPEQVADELLTHLHRGDFYVLCPDNDVTVAMDHARLQWQTDDVRRNRPALSRWHEGYAAEFARFMDHNG